MVEDSKGDNVQVVSRYNDAWIYLINGRAVVFKYTSEGNTPIYRAVSSQ